MGMDVAFLFSGMRILRRSRALSQSHTDFVPAHFIIGEIVKFTMAAWFEGALPNLTLPAFGVLEK